VSPPPAEGQAALGEVMGPSLPPGFVRVGQPSPLVAQDMAREEVLPAVVVSGQEGLIEGRINPGQGIYDALVACRLSPGKIQPALDALGKVVDFKKAKAGDPFVVRYDAQGKIVELSYQPSAEVTHTAKLVQGQYKTSDKKIPLEVRLEGVAGTVKTSVYAGLRDLGLSQATITKFSDIFSNDINFASESKPGDTFRLVFEKIYADKKFLKNGDLVAVEYKTPKKTVRLLYDKPSGSWYSPEGKSSKRVYIQNPVPFARVTSKFGKRLHPVLKRWKMHNGVDYAAPTGTPVKAIAAGKVIHLAPSGASGNLIGVQHSNGTSSFYAHLSKFAASLKKGDQVKQGQVIGYVGSTGRSTGPHLHLAIKVGGAYVDPLSADAVRSGGLGGNELRVFRRDTRAALQRLDALKVQPPSAGPAEPEPQGGDEE
jgi:murein DD-endopeptidase MepM/ murein hydrolase activator NlpD